MKRTHIWQSVAALLLLAALMIQFWPDEAETAEADAAVRSRRAEGNQLADSPSPRQRAARTAAVRMDVVLSEHEQDQLGDFVLPPLEGHQVSLQVAVKSLLTAYHDACRRSRTKPLEFNFSFPPDNDRRISFSIERGTFDAALSRIASLAGYADVVNGLDVSFAAMSDDPEIYTRTFRLPPDFAEDLRNELRRLGIPHGPTTEELLMAAGIIGMEGQVNLNSSGTLTASLPIADLERIEERIPQETPRQLKAVLRLIHSDTSLGADVESLPPAELDELLASLAGKQGVRFNTLPSVTLRDQHPADIEMIDSHPDGWTGVKWNLEAERMGLSMLFRTSVDYRPNDHPKPYARDTTYGVAADGVSQISLAHEGDGEFLYRLLTLEIIDATGRPVRNKVVPDGGNFVAGAAVPGKPGFVFSPYNNKIVDVRDIPPGTLVADPNYPMSEKRFFRVP